METIESIRKSTVTGHVPKAYHTYIDDDSGNIIYTYIPHQPRIKIEQFGRSMITRDFPECKNKKEYIRALRDFHYLNF